MTQTENIDWDSWGKKPSKWQAIRHYLAILVLIIVIVATAALCFSAVVISLINSI